jgi:sigma-B regulation protein RsbU (phosphoserine phosphatase)
MRKPRPPIPHFPKNAAAPVAYPPIGRGRLPERLRPDAKLAQKVQRSLLPAELPQVVGYQFFAYYKPAQEVGGDYYDFIPLSPKQRRLAILLGDAAGKGVPAALLMAKLSSDARSSLLSQADPAAAITGLNNLVYQYTSRMDRFVTLAVAVLDTTVHTLTLVNAGHPAPLIYRRATGNLEEATTEDTIGLPLGIDKSFAYRSRQVQLQPGDCVLLYSDGVTDQLDNQNKHINKNVFLSAFQEGICAPQAVGKRIVKILKRHAAGQGQSDDITLVCFGRTEG